MHSTWIFKRGTFRALKWQALRVAPDGLDRREIATAVMRAKGLELNKRVFRISLAQNVVTLFGRLERKRVVRCVARRKGVKVWQV